MDIFPFDITDDGQYVKITILCNSKCKKLLVYGKMCYDKTTIRNVRIETILIPTDEIVSRQICDVIYVDITHDCKCDPVCNWIKIHMILIYKNGCYIEWPHGSLLSIHVYPSIRQVRDLLSQVDSFTKNMVSKIIAFIE